MGWETRPKPVYQLLRPPASSPPATLPAAASVQLRQPRNPAWLAGVEHLGAERTHGSSSIVLYATYAFPLAIDPEVDRRAARAQCRGDTGRRRSRHGPRPGADLTRKTATSVLTALTASVLTLAPRPLRSAGILRGARRKERLALPRSVPQVAQTQRGGPGRPVRLCATSGPHTRPVRHLLVRLCAFTTSRS